MVSSCVLLLGRDQLCGIFFFFVCVSISTIFELLVLVVFISQKRECNLLCISFSNFFRSPYQSIWQARRCKEGSRVGDAGFGHQMHSSYSQNGCLSYGALSRDRKRYDNWLRLLRDLMLLTNHVAGGYNIKRVMEETECHIHFPDSNRNSVAEKSNQV